MRILRVQLLCGLEIFGCVHLIASVFFASVSWLINRAQQGRHQWPIAILIGDQMAPPIGNAPCALTSAASRTTRL